MGRSWVRATLLPCGYLVRTRISTQDYTHEQGFHLGNLSMKPLHMHLFLLKSTTKLIQDLNQTRSLIVWPDDLQDLE